MLTHAITAKRLEQLPEYFFAIANKRMQELAKSGEKILNFGIGSPDLAPHQSVIDTLSLEANKSDMHRYASYNGMPELRQALAKWYHRQHQITLNPDTQILPLGGSKQGLVYITMALTDPGDEVLVPNPGYSTYARGCLMTGAVPVEYQLLEKNDYLPDYAALEKMDLSKIKAMWISYPHNPTGAVATATDLEKMLAFARAHDLILVSDNPYSHLTFGDSFAPSLLELAKPEDKVVEFNSMSKTYNMAGWRIGWAAGHPEIIAGLSAIYSNIETGIFMPLQKAAITALNLPDSWIKERNLIYKERADKAGQIADKLGCSYALPEATLYLWVKLPASAPDSEKFSWDLLESKRIFITPGSMFGSAGEGYLRIGLTQPVATFDEALQRL